MATFGNDEHGYGKIFDAMHKAAVAFGNERSYAADFLIDAQAIVGRSSTVPFLWMIHNTSTHIWFADENNFGPKAATPAFAQNLYRGQKEAIYYWTGSELLPFIGVDDPEGCLRYDAGRLAHEAYMLADEQQYGSARAYSDVEE